MEGYGFRFRLREWRWKLAGQYRRPLPPVFTEPLRGAEALEIGGPSPAFERDGRLPVYGLPARLDGCNFAADTLWERHDDLLYRPEGGEATGRLWLLEAGDLAEIPDASYDVVLMAHVVEHLADPLGALAEWRRVVRPGGHLLLVIPHREGTFDHRRPVTPLEHMVADREASRGEDDLTHLDEVLRLHDLRRDAGVGDWSEFARRARENARYRGLHHHVFTTESAIRLVDAAGLELAAVEPRWRQDIFCLARATAGPERPDNSAHLAPEAAWRRRSPFRADRSGRVARLLP